MRSLVLAATCLLGRLPASAEDLPAPAASTAPVRLTYQQAIDEGLRNNRDLLAARYNIPLAQADELTAGLWNNPSLLVDTVFEPFAKNWNQTSAGGPRQFDYGLSYPFDFSGKIPAARRSAHKATEAAQAAYQDAVRQKLRDIQLAYIDVMTFQQQLALSREKEASLQHLVTVIESRIGGSSRLPLMRLRAQLARDQAMLDRRQREVTLRTARVALAIVLGRRQETPIETATPLRDFATPQPPALAALVAQTLTDRPDLQALRLALEKSRLDRSLALAQRWDNVGVSAAVSSQGPTDPNPNDPASARIPRGWSWDAAVSLPLPLFNRNQGNIRKADLTAEQVQKQIAALELAVAQEIAGVYDQLLLNRALILDYEARQLPNARKVRDEQQRLVGMGSNSLLDYFDALGAYTAAVSAYYDAVGEYRRGVARLNAACARSVLP